MSAEISCEVIATRAEQDAINMLAQGLEEVANPYPPGTKEAVCWKIHFQRVLALPDAEGSAPLTGTAWSSTERTTTPGTRRRTAIG